jgi:hypothetical protein
VQDAWSLAALSSRISLLAQAVLLTLFHGAREEWAEIKPVRSEAPGFGSCRSNEANFDGSGGVGMAGCKQLQTSVSDRGGQNS